MKDQIKIVRGKPVRVKAERGPTQKRGIDQEALMRLYNANEERRKIGLPELPVGGEPDEPERDRILRRI